LNATYLVDISKVKGRRYGDLHRDLSLSGCVQERDESKYRITTELQLKKFMRLCLVEILEGKISIEADRRAR